MGTRVRGWRWRPNPLRRRCDVVEAWTALVVAVLLCVGAPLTGLVIGRQAFDTARGAAAEQRAERHRVRAEVTEQAPAAIPNATGAKQPAYWVGVRWTEPGERERTGKARVPAGTRPGDHTHVWLDDAGRVVGAPADSTAIWQQALAVGGCATGGAATVVLAGRFVVRRVALRHRMAEWEREWARTGPEWGRRWA
ncbi:hypothetical protein [Streptomyces sp. NPDC048825]|uniref:Rv1733c family protein n=1 Tax=Streptomyces sp. NPDC048825 TaxID=3365592 RepID=UPI0037167F89